LFIEWKKRQNTNCGLEFRGKQSALYLLGNHILIWKVFIIGAFKLLMWKPKDF
jgi:hypothetical protein